MFLAKNKDLLARFKAGEREAMDEVYRHYEPGVSRFLRKGFSFRSKKGNFYFKGILDEGECAAAVQEVFRRAFEDKARASYNGINSFTNWVLAIARNMVINKFRNREIALSQYVSKSDPRSHLAVMDDEFTGEYSGLLYGQPSGAQDRLLEQAQLKQLLADFMDELNEDEKHLLRMRFVEGRGQEETAQAMGSTRMKVRTAEAKVRNRLRAFLRDSGYIDHMPLAKKKRRY